MIKPKDLFTLVNIPMVVTCTFTFTGLEEFKIHRDGV